MQSGNDWLLNANIHFRDKGGYNGNNAHDYSRFYHFTDSDDIWTAPHKDGTYLSGGHFDRLLFVDKHS